jgi:hypothetical protein
MNWFFRLLGIDQDTLREERIEEYRQLMIDAPDSPTAMHYWRCMKREIAMRSPEQVARMERERGLA